MNVRTPGEHEEMLTEAAQRLADEWCGTSKRSTRTPKLPRRFSTASMGGDVAGVQPQTGWDTLND